MKIFAVLLFVFCLACKADREVYTEDMEMKPKSEMVFDNAKWKMKDGVNYPYRDKMLNDIVYNDTVRGLNKDQIIDLLGEPSYYRSNKNFLYYTITEKHLALMTLHSKTMVIKLSEGNTIDWIKIHE